MPLAHILNLIAANGGIDLTDENQLLYTTAKVNQASKEIYDKNDCVGSLREEVYDVNIPVGNLVSLEPYVGVLRAVRYYYPQLNLKLRTRAPRYQAKFWQVENFLSWEMKGNSPLRQNIINDSILTFTFKTALSVSTTISIIGTSSSASQLVESIVCPIGTTQVSSLNPYRQITTLSAYPLRNADCCVTDVDGNEISVIPNHQYRSEYQWVQIVNLPNNQYGTSANFVPATSYVEVLWKLRWKPMANPQDEFVCPGYDEAIFWKYAENMALLDSTQSIFTANQADKYKTKCETILKDIAQDASQSAEMSLNFGENPTLEAFAYIQHNRNGWNYPYDGNGYGSGGTSWP